MSLTVTSPSFRPRDGYGELDKSEMFWTTSHPRLQHLDFPWYVKSCTENYTLSYVFSTPTIVPTYKGDPDFGYPPRLYDAKVKNIHLTKLSVKYAFQITVESVFDKLPPECLSKIFDFLMPNVWNTAHGINCHLFSVPSIWKHPEFFKTVYSLVMVSTAVYYKLCDVVDNLPKTYVNESNGVIPEDLRQILRRSSRVLHTLVLYLSTGSTDTPNLELTDMWTGHNWDTTKWFCNTPFDNVQDSIARILLHAIADRMIILMSWTNWFPWKNLGKHSPYRDDGFMMTFLRRFTLFMGNYKVVLNSKNKPSSTDDFDSDDDDA